MSERLPHIVLIGGDGSPSGVPRHITDLVRALQRQAHITVISEADKGGYSEITGLGAAHIPLSGLSSRIDPLHWRAGRKILSATLNELSPDLVWAHARMPVIWLRQMIIAGQWVPLPHTNLAISFHSLPFGPGHRPGTSSLARRMERQLLGSCPPMNLVFLTASQADRMETTVGSAIKRHRIHVLGNASHLGTMVAPEQRPDGRHIVMTGRAGWQKNYAAAVRLMKFLPEDVTLSLCGAGTETDRFKAQVKRISGSASSRIHALGPLPDVRPLLASADGYMLTSRYEGQPIGALEACEYGLPLIVAGFEDADALIDGHPAALKLSGSRPEKAADVDRLLSKYTSNRNTLAPAICAFWAERFGPDRFAQSARTITQQFLRK